MTLTKFNMLLAMTERLGIKTLGELAEIKRQNAIATNDELYDYLFMQVVRG